jgi:hypothetical protein
VQESFVNAGALITTKPDTQGTEKAQETMTRQTMLYALLAAPLGAVAVRRDAANAPQDHIVHFGPGRYTVRPGGGIWITGVRDCRFENCHIEGTTPRAITIE